MKNENNFENEEIKKNEKNSEEGFDIEDFYPEKDGDESENVTLDDRPTSPTSVFQVQQKKEKKNGKLTKKQLLIIVIVFLVYTVVMLTAAWLIFYRPHVNTNEIPFDINEKTDTEKTPDDKNKEPTPVVVDEGYTENGYSYNILLVGHDKLAHLADVTMIINCDTKNNTVTVMQIPRDTYVASEQLTGKINAMYSTYYNDARIAKADDPYIRSLNDYASLLEKNLCINIHHVALVNLDGFKNIVDSLGGVDVYVPNAMYYSDPDQGLYIDIPAGMQHLNGTAAEGFVRFRSGYVQADLGRVNAQKIFLTAFFSKIKATVKSVDVVTLNNLITQIQNNVHTDLTASDIMFYAKLALKIDLDSITMMTLPGSVSGMYYVMNRSATLKAINNYFNVYNKDISDSIFDRNRVFCNENSQYISAVYYDDPENVLDGEYKADSINDNSIYIPRTQTVVQIIDDTYEVDEPDEITEELPEEVSDEIPGEEQEEIPFDITEPEDETEFYPEDEPEEEPFEDNIIPENEESQDEELYFEIYEETDELTEENTEQTEEYYE